MRGREVCYYHGGKAAPPTAERNGAYRHGYYAMPAVEKRRELRALLKAAMENLEAISKTAARA